VIGSCTTNGGVIYFYSPEVASTAQAFCDLIPGSTWMPG
jgi:hypothetical protein